MIVWSSKRVIFKNFLKENYCQKWIKDWRIYLYTINEIKKKFEKTKLHFERVNRYFSTLLKKKNVSTAAVIVDFAVIKNKKIKYIFKVTCCPYNDLLSLIKNWNLTKWQTVKKYSHFV